MAHIGERRVQHYLAPIGSWSNFHLSPSNPIRVDDGDSVLIRVKGLEEYKGLDEEVLAMQDKLLVNFRFHDDLPAMSPRTVASSAQKGKKRNIDAGTESPSRKSKKRKIESGAETRQDVGIIDLTSD